jgi:hypothetical protein
MTALKRTLPLALLLLGGAGPGQETQLPTSRPPQQTQPSRGGPHHQAHSNTPHRTRTAGSPARPAPPRRNPGSALTAAPVPNESVRAPTSPVESRTHAEPTLFDLGNKYQGDGYVYGSSPQAMDDRRAMKVPGIEVKVPLK